MQTFKEFADQQFTDIDFLPGSSISVLAEPAPDGSIHRLKMRAGTKIPRHTHPADEFVYVLSGTLKTAGRECRVGTFWKTPKDIEQGPHEAITDVEIMTIRLGAMGTFDKS